MSVEQEALAHIASMISFSYGCTGLINFVPLDETVYQAVQFRFSTFASGHHAIVQYKFRDTKSKLE